MPWSPLVLRVQHSFPSSLRVYCTKECQAPAPLLSLFASGFAGICQYWYTGMMPPPSKKELRWVGSSKKDLMDLPREVVRALGFALETAQFGGMAENAKAMKGFGGASVIEICDKHNKQEFRAVYVVRFEEAIYVLHAFQKKSKAGIATPKRETDLIASRLRDAELIHKEYEDEKKN